MAGELDARSGERRESPEPDEQPDSGNEHRISEDWAATLLGLALVLLALLGVIGKGVVP